MSTTTLDDVPAQQLPVADNCSGIALVVDDVLMDRRLVGAMVERTTNLRVVYAADGLEALAAFRRELPVVVLTDLQMPRLDGLALVDRLRGEYPGVPVVLLTGRGSEEIAIAALRAGAAGYVPKRNLASDLQQVLEQVLAAARVERRRQRLLESVRRLEYHFVFDNDPELMPLFAAQMQEQMASMGLCDANDRIRIGISLEEAALNGIYHGNLELRADPRQEGSNGFYRLAEQRRGQAPYRGRRLHVHAALSPDRAVFVIRDEGPGFDVSALLAPSDPENLIKPSGRGLLLIRTFMDEVRHNDRGNEITLVKRRA